ncbi:MAG: substrate-binding domain-containing protein [Myxococcales bacterium]|nr:substrate-binding domain-containing protein [Myxococcales bacterium]
MSPRPPGFPRPTPTRSAWLLSLAALALVVGASLGLARGIEASDAPAPTPTEIHPAPRDRCLVAGSGSNLALTQRLLDAYLAEGGLPVDLARESVGSAGGLRALRDGAIDAALVSRRLGPDEATGLRVIPYAATEVVLVTPDDDATPIAPAAVAALFRGERADVTPLLRELGDSGVATLRSRWPALADAHDEAVREARFEVLFSDDAMATALDVVRDATGLFDRGQLLLRGLHARARPIREGDETPPWKELAVVVHASPPTWSCLEGPLDAWIAWLTSPAARELTEALGYFAPDSPEGPEPRGAP